jgi:hypothetical protein
MRWEDIIRMHLSGIHCENGGGSNWPIFLSSYGMSSVELSQSTSRELVNSLNPDIHLIIFPKDITKL